MIKKIILGIAAFLVIALALFLIWVATYPVLSKTKTAGGLPRSQSQYLTMRDGTQIAVEVWLPPDLAAGEQVPTLVEATRYSRGTTMAQQLGFKEKLLIRLGQVDPRLVALVQLDPESTWANEAGFAVVMVDARGSAASFGSRPIEWSPDEVADYGEVIAWVSEQPWSNGKVGAWGTSYPGNTAELMASTGKPAFLATAPRFSDFDPLLGVGMPGGLRADGFLDQWSEFNAGFDTVPEYAKAVDTDKNGKLLKEAFNEHNNPNIAQTMRAIQFRDDEYGQSGLTFASASPYNLQEEIEANDVPMQVWVSWLDAGTVDGALSRYLTFNNPQQVIIGAWSHGGGPNVDPYMPDEMPEDATEAMFADIAAKESQMAQVLDFFDCHLRDTPCQDTTSKITYYTLNSGEWKTTSVWPPEGFTPQRWYFADDNSLSLTAPKTEGIDEYAVDFTASTGTSNRWYAQMDRAVNYGPNRAQEDEKLLTYTSPPMTGDIEITGSPIATFYVDSSTEDGAFHVYLEDVAPDGKVTYISEGILRAIHHPVSKEEPPYAQLGPYHSFNREDAQPLVPGEVTEISLNLYATSVLIEKGHSLRVALAGADADTFARYPEEGQPVWMIHHSPIYPSHIELPVMEK
jgi:putative CocE/NonD family hydrolase